MTAVQPSGPESGARSRCESPTLPDCIGATIQVARHLSRVCSVSSSCPSLRGHSWRRRGSCIDAALHLCWIASRVGCCAGPTRPCMLRSESSAVPSLPSAGDRVEMFGQISAAWGAISLGLLWIAWRSARGGRVAHSPQLDAAAHPGRVGLHRELPAALRAAGCGARDRSRVHPLAGASRHCGARAPSGATLLVAARLGRSTRNRT